MSQVSATSQTLTGSLKAGPEAARDMQVRRSNFGIIGRLLFAMTVIIAMTFGVGGWALNAELSGAVVTQGTVVVEQSVKRVQHRDGGIVAAVFVQNGDRVEPGQLLVRLDGTQVRAELGVVKSQLVELTGRLARLAAERDQLDKVTFSSELLADPDAAGIVAGEARLFADGKKTREGQKQQMSQRIAQLDQETVGYGVQSGAKGQELALVRRELDKMRGLFKQNLTPETRVYALEREEARLAGERGNLIAQGARVGGQISEINLQILALDQTARTDAQRELRTVEARISELNEKASAAADKLSRIEIKSSSFGIIHELNVHTIGGIVGSAESLMTIVPNDEALSIEMKVAPVEIDRIFVGQDVRLKFTSFNQKTTPELDGRITYISPDISHDPKSKQDYYTTRAIIAGKDTRTIAGKTIRPGMQVEAFITTEKRSAFSYFAKPIVDQFSRTFREQ
ncbi:MAG: HlyD family type I secretion periplasmic adaptor subunit [Hyphomicrobiaceae bacterium]|nr:HlyD family type I secretion periplasmic adaptor subunit [Hyphomicrobiaceae bacterium]